uniref:Uncharacterized protein n=1 Tax=Lepeophtheirus salmonis TaxID=72036 RepID=A0A0K2TDC3_LEPSM
MTGNFDLYIFVSNNFTSCRFCRMTFFAVFSCFYIMGSNFTVSFYRCISAILLDWFEDCIPNQSFIIHPFPSFFIIGPVFLTLDKLIF